MEPDFYKQLLRKNGIIGAGGAGFPSYAKLDERADTIILNCAECEPLLKLHRQLMQKEAGGIMTALDTIREVLGAKSAIIGIKKEYTKALESIAKHSLSFPHISVCELSNTYPMGDEVILIYEATGRVVRPGGLPIEVGVIVYNVETMYNIYRAMSFDLPVTAKYVSVVGNVAEPKTVLAPIGMRFSELVNYCGGETTEDNVYMIGGPMMGRIQAKDEVVTKKTNAILVLDKNHTLVNRTNRSVAIDLKRAASICCQCRACTDLCPRNQIGHPIDPAMFMRVASNRTFSDVNPFLDTMYCSSCGICEMYACPQSLAPRTIIGEYKAALRAAKVAPQKNPGFEKVSEHRSLRKVPEHRLSARLDLLKYEDKPCVFDGTLLKTDTVRIPLNSHIGAPAIASVKIGDKVVCGQEIATFVEAALSTSVHASIDGTVVSVDESCIIITGK